MAQGAGPFLLPTDRGALGRGTPLGPSLLICQMGTMMVPTSRGSCEALMTGYRSSVQKGAWLSRGRGCSSPALETRRRGSRGHSAFRGPLWQQTATQGFRSQAWHFMVGVGGDAGTGVYREKRLWERGRAVGSLFP